MEEKTITTAFTITPRLLKAAKAFSKANGASFSEFLRIIIAREIGEPIPDVSAPGGDFSRYKDPETYRRICEKMREAKAKKRKEARKRIIKNVTEEAERRRKAKLSSGVPDAKPLKK